MTIKRQILVAAGVAFLVLSACDSNVISDDSGTGSSSLTDPNNTVAVNAGPVAQILAEDVLNFTNEVRAAIPDYIDEMTGSSTSGGSNLLTIRFTEQNDEISDTVTFSDTLSCDSGGSRVISGSAEVTLDSDRISGTVVGTFTLDYNNCEETTLLTAADATCASTPTIDGELPSTIAIDFSLSSFQDESTVNDNTDVASATDTALDVSVGSTASEQRYSFSYTLRSDTTDDGFEGTVSYEGEIYDLEELTDFIASLNESVACP